MPEARSSTESSDPMRGSPREPLGWWAQTPAVSIAVFLIVAVFTIDSSASSSIGLALIAGVLIGPLASYLVDTYWPQTATEERPAPPTASPGTKP